MKYGRFITWMSVLSRVNVVLTSQRRCQKVGPCEILIYKAWVFIDEINVLLKSTLGTWKMAQWYREFIVLPKDLHFVLSTTLWSSQLQATPISGIWQPLLASMDTHTYMPCIEINNYWKNWHQVVQLCSSHQVKIQWDATNLEWKATSTELTPCHSDCRLCRVRKIVLVTIGLWEFGIDSSLEQLTGMYLICIYCSRGVQKNESTSQMCSTTVMPALGREK